MYTVKKILKLSFKVYSALFLVPFTIYELYENSECRIKTFSDKIFAEKLKCIYPKPRKLQEITKELVYTAWLLYSQCLCFTLRFHLIDQLFVKTCLFPSSHGFNC